MGKCWLPAFSPFPANYSKALLLGVAKILSYMNIQFSFCFLPDLDLHYLSAVLSFGSVYIYRFHIQILFIFFCHTDFSLTLWQQTNNYDLSTIDELGIAKLFEDLSVSAYFEEFSCYLDLLGTSNGWKSGKLSLCQRMLSLNDHK